MIILTSENLTTKRPGLGLAAKHWHKLLFKESKVDDFIKDDMIDFGSYWFSWNILAVHLIKRNYDIL